MTEIDAVLSDAAMSDIRKTVSPELMTLVCSDVTSIKLASVPPLDSSVYHALDLEFDVPWWKMLWRHVMGWFK